MLAHGLEGGLTWLRLDDGFHRHRKVAPLSDRAFRLHVMALLESSAQLTDGRIDRAIPATWPSAPRGRTLEATIRELETAGLWHPTEAGWEVHGFADWNPSSDEVRANREAARARMRSLRSRGVRANTERTSPDVRDPVPVPVPIPIEPAADAAGSPRAAAAAEPERDLTDSEAECVCPLDLADRARDAGVLRQLAEKLGQPLVSVEDAAREFTAYWTIGGGSGQRRRRWLAKLRQQVVKRAGENQLRAPGAIAHGGDGPSAAQIHPDVARFLSAGGRQ